VNQTTPATIMWSLLANSPWL